MVKSVFVLCFGLFIFFVVESKSSKNVVKNLVFVFIYLESLRVMKRNGGGIKVKTIPNKVDIDGGG